jgi:hypothetical protein
VTEGVTAQREGVSFGAQGLLGSFSTSTGLADISAWMGAEEERRNPNKEKEASENILEMNQHSLSLLSLSLRPLVTSPVKFIVVQNDEILRHISGNFSPVREEQVCTCSKRPMRDKRQEKCGEEEGIVSEYDREGRGSHRDCPIH